jgi:hypothetical protein
MLRHVADLSRWCQPSLPALGPLLDLVFDVTSIFFDLSERRPLSVMSQGMGMDVPQSLIRLLQVLLIAFSGDALALFHDALGNTFTLLVGHIRGVFF